MSAGRCILYLLVSYYYYLVTSKYATISQLLSHFKFFSRSLSEMKWLYYTCICKKKLLLLSSWGQVYGKWRFRCPPKLSQIPEPSHIMSDSVRVVCRKPCPRSTIVSGIPPQGGAGFPPEDTRRPRGRKVVLPKLLVSMAPLL